jgi:hypothetical protein
LCAQTDSAPQLTFVDDVATILHHHCATCHRAGEMAPMSLLTWDEVRPWVKSIRKVVASGEMPPWHADSRYGPYRNARGLDDGTRRTLLDWIDAGAARGEGTTPAPPVFAEGWQGGEPDVIVSLPQEVSIPADGGDEYHYVLVPTGFLEDRWVQSAEIRPGNRKVLHHATVFVFPPERIEQGSDGPRLKPRDPTGTGLTERVGKVLRVRSDAPVANDGCTLPDGGSWPGSPPQEGPQIGVFLPGKGPDVRPAGTAVRVPAGAWLMFQLHYSPTVEPATDRTRIGLRFAADRVENEVKRVEIWNNLFEIPAGAAAHDVRSCYRFERAVRAVSFTAHMHYRGSAMSAEALYPDGTSEIVFSVPAYSFNWQTTYVLDTPRPIPAGTTIRTTALFDNSDANPLNPDSSQTVRWGEATTSEMMGLWIEYVEEAAREARTQ